jgi:transposase InsO family protein
MPWKETDIMDERVHFLGMYREGELSIAALCRCFGISRATGYKWIARYESEGIEGLKDRSRAPHRHPNMVSEEIERSVVSYREKHPTRGPSRIHTELQEKYPGKAWPAASTIGDIIKRHGLTKTRRRNRKSPPYSKPFQSCTSSDAVWSADFKGHFNTGDGQRCNPFTLADNYSRFLLRCQIVSRPDYEGVKPIMEAAFREYGLPLAIRTDNGPPFATITVGGLSRLSVWLIRLGIQPERIKPGKPAQNGRLERLHRTLKEETATPPKSSLRAQQKAFDSFREEYNYQRPHQALNQKPPVSIFRPSSRPFPERLPEIVYPDEFELRAVRSQGEFKWKSHSIFISNSLINQTIAFQKLSDCLWNIYFSNLRLAVFDSKDYHVIREPYKIKRINLKFKP